MFSSYKSSSSSATGKIVGLDVGGKLFFFHSNVLLHSGSTYFAKRLKGGDADGEGVAYTDERGRQVYFIDRPPSRFEYVRDYLVTDNLHLPEKNVDLALIRNLREEAAFFGLKGMVDLLKTNRTISPDRSNKGVLYWLGTERGTTSYQNPYSLGAIHVGRYSAVQCSSMDAYITRAMVLEMHFCVLLGFTVL